MEYVLIHQSLFVQINHSNELSVWRIKRSQLYYKCRPLTKWSATFTALVSDSDFQ